MLKNTGSKGGKTGCREAHEVREKDGLKVVAEGTEDREIKRFRSYGTGK